MTTQEIVSKLWNLCNVLRDDGITYHQYVTELTYILFLKMATHLFSRRELCISTLEQTIKRTGVLSLLTHDMSKLAEIRLHNIGTQCIC